MKWNFKHFSLFFLSFFISPLAYASFIESSEGAAVIKDATAAYHNPAALSLLKNTQIVGLGSLATFRSEFDGQTTQTATGFTQSGRSSASTEYYLPSAYLGIPITPKLTFGFAIVSNFFNRDAEENAILRYVQANNSIQDVDFIPALSLKINDYIAVGGALNFSYARFLLEPTSGFPSLNIPDTKSQNDTRGKAFGGDAGILLTPNPSTLIGFNFRSSLSYTLSGTSTFNSTPQIVSNDYHFNFWTPARGVLSVSHLIMPKVGMIGTVQYIFWNIFKELTVHELATPVGILPTTTVPYHLHNSWVFTLGGHYRAMPQWIIRAAGSFAQSPANTNYQIANGDSIVLGASTGYEITKHFSIDLGYAHMFLNNETIQITSGRNLISGVNKGSRNSISLKLTMNV